MIGRKLGEAIKAILSADSGVTAVLGQRVYPNIAAQKAAFPYAVYMTEGVKPQACRMPGNRFDGTFQVSVIDTNYPTAQAGIDAIRLALDNYAGIASDTAIRTETGRQLDPGYDETLKVNILTIEYTVFGKITT